MLVPAHYNHPHTRTPAQILTTATTSARKAPTHFSSHTIFRSSPVPGQQLCVGVPCVGRRYMVPPLPWGLGRVCVRGEVQEDTASLTPRPVARRTLRGVPALDNAPQL